MNVPAHSQNGEADPPGGSYRVYTFESRSRRLDSVLSLLAALLALALLLVVLIPIAILVIAIFLLWAAWVAIRVGLARLFGPRDRSGRRNVRIAGHS